MLVISRSPGRLPHRGRQIKEMRHFHQPLYLLRLRLFEVISVQGDRLAQTGKKARPPSCLNSIFNFGLPCNESGRFPPPPQNFSKF